VLEYPEASSAAASAVMRGNRKRDSKPELAIRSLVHAAGLRYRANLLVRLEPGRSVRPDMVFPGRRLVVFIDGCFWHGCAKHGTKPRTNAAYWEAKIARNRTRDARNTADLERNGWTVIRVWEHEAHYEAARKIGRVARLAAHRRVKSKRPKAEVT
jgi:DNA mismatch endonuclease (patch repair protein)